MQIQTPGTPQTQRTGTQQLIVIFLGILVVIMLGGVLYLTSSIVLPFMVALFLAYLLDPLVRFLKYFRVPLALAVCFAWLWGVVGAVLAVPIMATIKIVCENLPPLRFLSALMSEE